MGDSIVVAEPEVKYFESTLDVAIEEIRRLRGVQSSIITSMYSRASVLVGASGVAATLTANSDDSIWFLLPIAGFIIAALAGARVMFPATGMAMEPERVLHTARGNSAVQLKHAIATGIVADYKSQKVPLRVQRFWSIVGLISFVFAATSVAGLQIVNFFTTF
ncbi:hypothetical protein E3T46_00985 [Cryobacterium sp. Hh11]|uniref:hypothetical protein n=1 Tax=Cryobacterium sp. Hh11 TaxID=2555868 RepID=UPI00106A9C7A|nr:hypothetical protein [Cryobacterium sp. Hh11]TFD54264.1 hypothetical protein E3T46_00985 [Cryobacterium sp. Hh11]